MSEGNDRSGDEPGSREGPGFRVHPLDLLVLVLAVFFAIVAYTFLFDRQPVERPVDPLLGRTVVLEHKPHRDWMVSFPTEGQDVLLDDLLVCDVEEVTFQRLGNWVRFTLKVRERSDQRPDAMTQFRTGIRRGSRVTVSDRHNTIEAEVIDAGEPKERP